MLFEILGPFRCAAGMDLDLARRREGRILAALLLSSRHVVSMHRLVDMLWGEDPPATARQQVQNCAAALARLFRERGVDLALRRTESCYELAVGTEDLDAAMFEDEVARARGLAEAHDHAAAAALLRSALGRWRGAVLPGMDLGRFGAVAARLEELRMQATEQLFDLDLGLGRHGELLADLAEAAAAHPDRERLVGLYMLALARSGRAAEALAAFQQTRRVLVDEYALEPGPELQAIQRSILRAGTAAQPPAWPPQASADDLRQRLLAAVALAEVAKRQLELALQGARGAAQLQR